jgi:nitroreductase
MEGVLEYIFRRRSSRKFLDQPVEPEKLELLIKAGMAAPSAMNVQPWEFLIITDPARLEALRTILPYGKFRASAVIAVCGNTLSSQLFWVQDCSAASENILLASYELGLGACWIGIHPVPVLKTVVHKFLGLPRTIKPLSLIYLGYPEFFKNPRTQFDPAKVHWEKFGQHRESAAKAL